MNIFWLDKFNEDNVAAYVDKHVVKMILEYTQLLCTAHHVLDGEEMARRNIPLIYKKTHVNHPCAVWVREDGMNYATLTGLLLVLHVEYAIRYNKVHKSMREGLFPSMQMLLPKNIPRTGKMTPKPLCMPDQYKVEGDPITSYRNYYIGEKSHIAKWTNRPKPDWYI